MSTEPKQAALELVTPQNASPLALIGRLIDAGKLTAESVGIAERLVNLQRDMAKDEAERQFNAAFVRLQSELPVIVAQTAVPNRGKYERFEDLMERVGPLLRKQGFVVSFTQSAVEGRITAICNLIHEGGHSRANSFTVRTGRKADSDTQADSMAATTAKRRALGDALGLVIRQDVSTGEEGDASNEGAFISPEQVQYLKEQVAEKGANEEAFLRMAGAANYEEICNGSYPVLVRALQAKNRK